jgi:hypothetical protein
LLIDNKNDEDGGGGVDHVYLDNDNGGKCLRKICY